MLRKAEPVLFSAGLREFFSVISVHVEAGAPLCHLGQTQPYPDLVSVSYTQPLKTSELDRKKLFYIKML